MRRPYRTAQHAIDIIIKALHRDPRFKGITRADIELLLADADREIEALLEQARAG